MFNIDDRDVKKLERRLALMSSRAIPFATRETLNRMAFDARFEAQTLITREMVLRNKYTVNSIRVDKAKGMNIESQKSVVGSIADYMDAQEFGGTKRRKSGKAVVIPTAFSAGQGRGGRPRTRLPRGAFKMGSIMLQRAANRGKNRKQRNAINIATSLGTFTYLDLGRRKGIFKIDKKGNPTMVHDLTRPSVSIPKVRWMGRAIDTAAPKRVQHWVRALEFQLARIP